MQNLSIMYYSTSTWCVAIIPQHISLILSLALKQEAEQSFKKKKTTKQCIYSCYISASKPSISFKCSNVLRFWNIFFPFSVCSIHTGFITIFLTIHVFTYLRNFVLTRTLPRIFFFLTNTVFFCFLFLPQSHCSRRGLLTMPFCSVPPYLLVWRKYCSDIGCVLFYCF